MRMFAVALPLVLVACGKPDPVAPDTEQVREAETEAEPLSEEGTEEVTLDDDGTMVRDAAPRGSTYTSLGDCKRVENYEEGGGFRDSCEGADGWMVDYTQSDLRENVVLIDEAAVEHSLDLPGLVADGAFNALGKTLEWRDGPAAQGARALILRVNVARPDPMAPDKSLLAVARLDGPVCLVAIVPPGPGQNVAARALADRENLPACLGKAEQANAAVR